MDLVRIFHVVDTLSSGKHEFNHIYVFGLIQSILIHFDTVLFDSVHLDSLSLSGVHPMFMFWYGYCSKNVGLCRPFLTVCFLRFKVLFCIQWICVASHLLFDFCG